MSSLFLTNVAWYFCSWSETLNSVSLLAHLKHWTDTDLPLGDKLRTVFEKDNWGYTEFVVKFPSTRQRLTQIDSLWNTFILYKNEIRRKRYAYDKLKTEKLITSKRSNVKEYWRLLKKAANIGNGSTVSALRFGEYFQSINNPSDHFYQADEDIIFFNER